VVGRREPIMGIGLATGDVMTKEQAILLRYLFQNFLNRNAKNVRTFLALAFSEDYTVHGDELRERIAAWDALFSSVMSHGLETIAAREPIADHPRANPRRPFGYLPYADRPLRAYLESDRDYVDNNLDICVEFLDDLVRQGFINEGEEASNDNLQTGRD
jgi:hypothetical protein